MIEILKVEKEIAVDLEAHQYRTYQGKGDVMKIEIRGERLKKIEKDWKILKKIEKVWKNVKNVKNVKKCNFELICRVNMFNANINEKRRLSYRHARSNERPWMFEWSFYRSKDNKSMLMQQQQQ